jgi:tetratricopeptide (TPR) repeat protein
VLLDRQRVKFWQKWVFGIMALIMAAFLIMIPINRSSGCGGSSATNELDKEVAKYAAAVKADPKSAVQWGKLGDIYLSRAVGYQTEGSNAQKADLQSATAAYERQVKLLRKEKGSAAKAARIAAYTSLVTVAQKLANGQAEESAYAQLVGLQPRNADNYFGLGTAASSAGDMSTAFLAYRKFIELDPQSSLVPDVKAWLKANQPKATPSPSPTKGAGQ